MERPTWKNTLYSNHTKGHSLNSFVTTARGLGYEYIEWNGHIISTDNDSGMYEMHMLGTLDFPICNAEELDSPGGVRWCNGLRPILQDAILMAHDTLRTGTTLLGIISGRLMSALTEIAWLKTDAAATKIKSALDALDDRSLRGSDPNGSIAFAVAALRVRVDLALSICQDPFYQQERKA